VGCFWSDKRSWNAPGDPASASRVTQRTPHGAKYPELCRSGLVHCVLTYPTLLSLFTHFLQADVPCSPRLMLCFGCRNRVMSCPIFPTLSSQMSAAQVCLRESGMWTLELACQSQVIGLYSLCFQFPERHAQVLVMVWFNGAGMGSIQVM
jgi:hypothetical protein